MFIFLNNLILIGSFQIIQEKENNNFQQEKENNNSGNKENNPLQSFFSQKPIGNVSLKEFSLSEENFNTLKSVTNQHTKDFFLDFFIISVECATSLATLQQYLQEKTRNRIKQMAAQLCNIVPWQKSIISLEDALAFSNLVLNLLASGATLGDMKNIKDMKNINFWKLLTCIQMLLYRFDEDLEEYMKMLGCFQEYITTTTKNEISMNQYGQLNPNSNPLEGSSNHNILSNLNNGYFDDILAASQFDISQMLNRINRTDEKANFPNSDNQKLFIESAPKENLLGFSPLLNSCSPYSHFSRFLSRYQSSVAPKNIRQYIDRSPLPAFLQFSSGQSNKSQLQFQPQNLSRIDASNLSSISQSSGENSPLNISFQYTDQKEKTPQKNQKETPIQNTPMLKLLFDSPERRDSCQSSKSTPEFFLQQQKLQQPLIELGHKTSAKKIQKNNHKAFKQIDFDRFPQSSSSSSYQSKSQLIKFPQQKTYKDVETNTGSIIISQKHEQQQQTEDLSRKKFTKINFNLIISPQKQKKQPDLEIIATQKQFISQSFETPSPQKFQQKNICDTPLSSENNKNSPVLKPTFQKTPKSNPLSMSVPVYIPSPNITPTLVNIPSPNITPTLVNIPSPNITPTLVNIPNQNILPTSINISRNLAPTPIIIPTQCPNIQINKSIPPFDCEIKELESSENQIVEIEVVPTQQKLQVPMFKCCVGVTIGAVIRFGLLILAP